MSAEGRARPVGRAIGGLGRVRRAFARTDVEAIARQPVEPASRSQVAAPIDIAENDPLLAYLQSTPNPVDLAGLQLDSRALRDLRAAGVQIVVPLVSQGELIGTLNLGPRRSEQEYSTDDRRLLENLAAQAAPALRVAQLVREQEAEARERQRMEQELQVAQLIQQHFLPNELPQPAGWAVQAYYRPARAVGGDFYDVLVRPDGKVAFTIGDVTDKGIPAAMVMAATRSYLRAAAADLADPGAVLARVNDQLQPDMPPRMFVTCLFGLLDPVTGVLRFANAGQNLPFLRGDGEIVELRATGMPLGLMPGLTYDETETVLRPGQQLLLHSDGIAEAHSPSHDMFGIPRFLDLVRDDAGGPRLIQRVLNALEHFTGPGWEQEDDITLVSIAWDADAGSEAGADPDAPGVRELASFELRSEPGIEREAMRRVVAAVTPLGLSAERLERLQTAVAEATMNAIEHGNASQPQRPVEVSVVRTTDELVVRITDQGGDQAMPDAAIPSLEAKLAGDQNPRGWGLFLIQNMVDELRFVTNGRRHTAELVVYLKGAPDA